MHNNPQIDPIFKRGTNGAGVLLLHGFTGTPDSMRPVANALHESGYTVSVPLIAGHGTTPEQCALTNKDDWYRSASSAFIGLHEQCSKIFVGGLSMGGLLALKLAVEYPQVLTAMALLATPLYLKSWIRLLLPAVIGSPLKYLWRFQKKMGIDMKDAKAINNFWNYERMPLSNIKSVIDLQNEMQRQLHLIETPTLLIHSRHDSTAPYDSMNAIAIGISSSVTETVTLDNSYHVITLDYEKERVARKVCEFFTRLL